MAHVRESFKNTRRYFTEIVGFIFWPLTLNFKCLVITWCFLLNIIISVSPEFRDNLLLRIHWQGIFKSRLMYLFIFLRDFLIKRILVSSAKWCTELCSIALFKSLIYRRNSNGPKTDSCGTPWAIFSFSELHSLILVYWYLSVKKIFKPLICLTLTS